MACHSGSLPVNFSDIDDQRAVLFVLSVFRTRPRVVRRAIHTSYPTKLSSVYIRINSHTSRAIYPSSCPPPHPSYIDSSIHFISLFLTAIFPTTNHLGTFAARLLVSLLLPFFFSSFRYRIASAAKLESEMQAAARCYTAISMIQSRHRLTSASPCMG